MSPQQSLYILLRIFGNLLELINRYDAKLVRMRQILENLIERIFGSLDISQLHIESGKIGDGVEPEFPADCLKILILDYGILQPAVCLPDDGKGFAYVKRLASIRGA